MRRTDGGTIFAGCLVGLGWLVGLLLTLAFWGVVAWGIVEVVQWLTAK